MHEHQLRHRSRPQARVLRRTGASVVSGAQGGRVFGCRLAQRRWGRQRARGWQQWPECSRTAHLVTELSAHSGGLLGNEGPLFGCGATPPHRFDEVPAHQSSAQATAQLVSVWHGRSGLESRAAHRSEQVLSMRPTSLAMPCSSVSASFTAARASLTASMVGAGSLADGPQAPAGGAHWFGGGRPL